MVQSAFTVKVNLLISLGFPCGGHLKPPGLINGHQLHWGQEATLCCLLTLANDRPGFIYSLVPQTNIMEAFNVLHL